MKWFVVAFVLLATPVFAADKPPMLVPGDAVRLAAGCHVISVAKQSTGWVATYDTDCTPDQIAAGNAVLSSYDFSAWEQWIATH